VQKYHSPFLLSILLQISAWNSNSPTILVRLSGFQTKTPPSGVFFRLDKKKCHANHKERFSLHISFGVELLYFFFVLMLGGSKLILTSWLIHANCCRTIFASFLFIPLFIKLACPANAKLDVNKTSSRQQLEGLTFHFSSLLFLVFLDYWIKSKVALTFSFQLLLPSVLNISYLYSVFFFKLVSGFLCRPSLSLTYNQLLNS